MKTIEEFYKEWENDKHYMGDEDSWAIWFAEDWEKYKQEQCNIADVVGQSEQFYCLNRSIFGDGRKCDKQCLSCEKNIPKQ
jgi:hypothetical protein